MGVEVIPISAGDGKYFNKYTNGIEYFSIPR